MGPGTSCKKEFHTKPLPPIPSYRTRAQTLLSVDFAYRLGQYRADILGLLLGVSELLPALATDLAQLCRPSRDAAAGFPARPGKR
jgi:hypothetical protein